MQKEWFGIIKDLIISILFVSCIVIILSIIFYDDISLSKIIPQSEEYILSNEMSEEIKQGNIENLEEVVVKYSMDAADLKKYKKNKEYIPEKQHPFAVESTLTTNTNNNSSSNINNTQSNSTHFYEDDGTK